MSGRAAVALVAVGAGSVAVGVLVLTGLPAALVVGGGAVIASDGMRRIRERYCCLQNQLEYKCCDG